MEAVDDPQVAIPKIVTSCHLDVTWNRTRKTICGTWNQKHGQQGHGQEQEPGVQT